MLGEIKQCRKDDGSKECTGRPRMCERCGQRIRLVTGLYTPIKYLCGEHIREWAGGLEDATRKRVALD
jgi:hypothetical protein